MAATAIPVNQITHALTADVAKTAGDAANGHTVVNDGRTFLVIDNNDVTNPHTLTFAFIRTVDGQAVTAKVVSVPQNTKNNRYLLGDPALYGTSTAFTVDSAQLAVAAYTV